MKPFYIKVLFALVTILIAGTTIIKAQNPDTLIIKKHSPRKATIMSAVIPGLGQAYNRKYWKIPVLYAGVAGIFYFADMNGKNYRTFRDAYKYRIDNNPATIDKYTDVYTNDNLNELKNYYRRNLEVTYIFAGLLYIINILDASVDANLYDYNINDNLTFTLNPLMDYCGTVNYTGLGIKLKFK